MWRDDAYLFDILIAARRAKEFVAGKEWGLKIMKIERFEDLEVWRLSRELVKSIYKLTSGTKFSKDFGLADQIQRSLDLIYINKDEFQANYDLAEKISKSLGGFIKYLQYHNLKSSNFESSE